MVKKTKETILLVYAVATIALIMALIPVARDLQKWCSRQSPYLLDLAAGGALLAALYLLYRTLNGRFSLTRRRLLIAALGLVLMTWYFLSLHILVERIHVVMYGGLALLWFAVFSSRYSGMVSAGLTLVLCALVGIADEWVQHLVPNRVGDYRDIITNWLSSALGLLIAAALISARGRRQPAWARPVVCIGAAACLWLAFCFTDRVNGFGYAMQCGGIRLYSAFPPRSLPALDAGWGRQLRAKVLDMARRDKQELPVGLSYGKEQFYQEFVQRFLKFVNFRNRFLRDFSSHAHKVAACERHILLAFFPSLAGALRSQGLLGLEGASVQGYRYESPVARDRFTLASRASVIVILAALTVLLMCCLLRRKRP